MKAVASQRSPCRLCGLDSVLCDSHYLPQSLYRIVARSYQPHDSAPVLYDARNHVVLRSNFQSVAKLLCRDCEIRFSSKAEDPIARQCFKGENKFRLKDRLLSLEHSDLVNGRRVFWGPEVEAKVGGQAVAYFVLSVLWRGSVLEWKAPFDGFFGALGPYESVIREYLLNPVELPQCVGILVYVDCDTPSRTGLTPPVTKVVRDLGPSCHAHDFMIPGLRFVVLVGKAAIKITKVPLSFVEWSFLSSDYARVISRALATADAKGKLAQETPPHR